MIPFANEEPVGAIGVTGEDMSALKDPAFRRE
jgi:hypothetical protein